MPPAAQASKTPDPLFLTVNDAAKLLQISPRMFYAFIRHKTGPKVVRFGTNIRIRRDDFEAWVATGKIPSPPKGY